MFKLFKKNKKEDIKVVETTLTLDKPLSSYMKDMLARSGYSKSEVADIMCVSHVSISRWLSGDRIPKVNDFLKFCNACGYDLITVYRIL